MTPEKTVVSGEIGLVLPYRGLNNELNKYSCCHTHFRGIFMDNLRFVDFNFMWSMRVVKNNAGNFEGFENQY